MILNTMYACRLVVSGRRSYVTGVGLLDDLAHRGLMHDVTHRQALHAALARPQSVYAGVDPTARALHIGHLLPLMTLLHFHLRGHTVIPLIGGATGRIGDPSGRLVERQPADTKQVEGNAASLTASIQRFFGRAVEYAVRRVGDHRRGPDAVVANNLEWHERVNMLDFLQHVAIHARVNTMLNRESVRARLSSQQGLSFTEFTYQLLQAYDFYHLHKHRACSIQVGGSDQWGNILAGLDLIARLDPPASSHSPPAFGITTPLLTTASGDKFGKSAGNAVWLDPGMTSVFDFYQYFVKVDDADVEKYLKLFTLLSWTDITQVMQTHTTSPEKRTAQRRLAAEVTEMVHSPDGLARAQTLTALLFDSDPTHLQAAHIVAALHDDPRLALVSRTELLDLPVFKLAGKYGLVASASAARNLITARGLYLNNRTVPDAQHKIDPASLIDDRVVLLRAGKDKVLVLATQE
ncbi:hypothetical protein BDZ94DRAFT_433124 [Collybia nuda]|uniref:Tyrosine--tRNA ligase n=1 Tax=Collybia nuda TaxID=64659 RepID=A0A9P6CLT7_9AGAR|nr:hypothetical protein BDZ94DRAFT_433124 [Collybia nuda]